MELKEVLAYNAGYRDGKRDATPPASAEWITWYHGQPDGKTTFSYSCSSWVAHDRRDTILPRVRGEDTEEGGNEA